MNKTNPIIYKKLANWIEPELVFSTLFASASHAFWLDSSMQGTKSSRFSYMGLPHEIISYSVADNKLIIEKNSKRQTLSQDIFSYLNAQLTKKRIQKTNLPFDFVGGYVGYFGYELKAIAGAKNNYHSYYPDSLWYAAEKIVVFDHKKHELYLFCLTKNKIKAEKWFEEIETKLQTPLKLKHNKLDKKKITYQLARSRQQYLKDIQKCKQYLRKGESYQICLTNTITIKKTVDPFSLYCILRKTNPAPYAAYIKHKDFTILSSSPEQFLKIESNGSVETKPIKGTIKRGQTAEEDNNYLKELVNNKKEWSENAMIVDLLRNDLGKVCKFGSVHVDKLMTVETYPTLHTLVSTVKGKLREDVSMLECVKACFPGGSMTGAPKIRAMEILESLEKKARGIYSGTLGFLSVNQTTTLSIVIRTMIATKDSLSIGVGGAILIDSNPEKEYDEMLLKAQALLASLKKSVYTTPMHIVFLALGSNVGDKNINIQQAIELLKEHINQISVAKLYETKPMYYEKQDNFLNTVLQGQTNLTPQELLLFVKKLEKQIGRVKRFQNGPREVDIDILFYDDLVFNNKDLQIPHPRMQERDFVLKPFMDISPDFVHPILKKTVKQIYESTTL
jgi:para-aminobenzoate synthetase